MKRCLYAALLAVLLSGCEPEKQVVPDEPAQPPKPKVAIVDRVQS